MEHAGVAAHNVESRVLTILVEQFGSIKKELAEYLARAERERI